MIKDREIINRIFDHVESGDIDKAVFACVRLSRNLGDVFNTIIFLRELYPDKKQLQQAFYDETSHLKDEGIQTLWKITAEAWLDERTLNHSITDNPKETVLAMGVGEMQKEIIHIKDTISDLKKGSG